MRFYNIVLLADQTWIDGFGGNAEMARMEAAATAQPAITALNNLFGSYYKLEFSVIFFPGTLAPPRQNKGPKDWTSDVRNFFQNQFPCVPYDCIMLFTDEFGNGFDFGENQVAIIAGTFGNGAYRVAHELGHTLGMMHVTESCCAENTFMCALYGNQIKFSSCEDIAFMNQNVFTSSHCSDWAYFQPGFPDDYACPPSPASVQLIVNTENSNPVVDCFAGGDEVTFKATIINNNQATARNIRALINNNNSAFVEFVPDTAFPFNCITPVTGGMEFRIVDPVTNDCNNEVLQSFAANEAKEFRFKVRYKGGIPAGSLSLNSFRVRVYSGSLASPVVSQNIDISPFVDINGGNYSTLYANNQWDNNNPLFIKGDLVMNLNSNPNAGNTYDFSNNKKLLFAAGKGLSVANTTTAMTHVDARGCENMWKGITVRSGSAFVSDMMTRISDADAAIQVQKGGTVDIRNTDLLNNNFAVRTETAGSGNYNITLKSNRFGTIPGELKAAYTGQNPVPLEKGFTGLFLRDAGSLNIGTDAVSGMPNEFFNLKYGILSYNTDLTVRNTVFQDITSVAKGAGYNAWANLIATGKAVYAEGGTVDVKGGIISSDPPVMFDNCHTGVHTLYASANIQETAMTGMTNGIISNGGTSANAEWNNIAASDRGISTAFLSGVNAGLSVKNNTVTMKGNAAGIGIGAGGSDLFPQNEGTIQDNIVTVQEGAAGIGVTAANKIKILQNTVSLTGNSPLYGIRLEGGDRNTVNCNTVTNSGSSDNAGIYAIHAGRANVVCNTAEGMARGLEFEGMLAGKQKANVAKNTLQNNGDAGLLLGTDAVIGEQRHKGNKWFGGVTKAQHLTPLVADLSLFIVDNNEKTEFLPDVVVPITWFLDESTSAVTDDNCEPGVTCPIATEPPGDAALDRKIARGELGGTTYQSAQQWLAQRRLYEKMTEEGNPYTGDADFNTFLSQAQSNGLSQYAGIQTGIRQLGGMSENARITAASSLSSQNSNLTGSAVYQTNEKAVNEIFLNTVAINQFSFSESQTSTLRAIADDCPLSGGEAVLRARAMLTLIDESPVAYDDDDLCGVGWRGEEQDQKNQSSSILRVYPNPADNELTIEYHFIGDTGRLLLFYNAYGQLVKEVSLPASGGKANILVKNMTAGVYWYVSPGTNAMALYGKIIINH